MKDIDWFGSLPTQSREDLLRKRSQISEKDRKSMLEYGEEYFDGGTPWGYGKYQYDGRFAGVVQKMIETYQLTPDSHILEVGCAKAYFLYEFYKKGFKNVHGLDISDYAITHVPEELKGKCHVGSAHDLSRWGDKTMDLVITKDTLHNLSPQDSIKAVEEIVRVSKNGKGFIQLSSYETEGERKGISVWVITIKTIRSKKEWLDVYKKAGYKGDFHFLCYDYDRVSPPAAAK